jgi:uncharacterized protein YjdB
MFTGRKLPITLAFGVLLGLAFGVSCKGFFVDPVLQSIEVGPSGITIQTGDTNNKQQFTAVGTFDDGKRPTNKVTWSIDPSDGSIATLSTGGLATAVARGTATITATSTDVPTIFGSTTLKVTVGCINSIDVTPSPDPHVTHGETLQFTAKAQTCKGEFDITDIATWTSSDTTVATIDSNGLADGIKQGATTNITAESAGVTSTVVVLHVD